MKLWLFAVGYFIFATLCGLTPLMAVLTLLGGIITFSVVFMLVMFVKVFKEYYDEWRWDKEWTKDQQKANIEFIHTKICKVNEDT